MTSTTHAAAPILVWLRQDLRVDDHEALSFAARDARGRVIPVYCIDPRQHETTTLGFARMGARRAQHLIQTLQSLRDALRALGSDLVIRRGHPEELLPALAQAHGAQAIAWHAEACVQERQVEREVQRRAQALGLGARRAWGATLFHPDDLPYPVSELPDVFSHFRRDLERDGISPRSPLDAPSRLEPLPATLDPGPMLTLDELGLATPDDDPRRAIALPGGCDQALARLERYIWHDDALRHYKETRDGLLGPNYSSKLSAWLATGALSPRRVWREVRRYERERVRNDSTYWLIFELMWRDYFRFLALREGAALFVRDGIQRRHLSWRQDRQVFERWRAGQTGVPFVDANMIELERTGFMSNRGRQNVASYLAKHQLIDWRWGAMWFESALIDYDPCSNWGNWQYVSGVGQDPRDRVFDVVGQGERYDAQARYIKRWLPALDALPESLAHRPSEIGAAHLAQRYGLRLGQDYPEALPLPEGAAAGRRGRRREDPRQASLLR